MHDKPDLEGHLEYAGQNRDEIVRTPGNALLAAADADAGAERGQLRQIAVAAKAEIRPGELLRKRACRTKGSAVAIEPIMP